MNSRYRRVYEMVLQVISFLDANLSVFSTIPVVQTYLDDLKAKAQTLTQLGIEKVSSTGEAKDATISRGDLRDRLRDEMRDIAEMWKAMADEIDNAVYKFRMPHGGSDQNLIAVARSFFEEATPLKDQFTGRGMPTDFLEKLDGSTDEFAAAMNESEDAYRARIGVNAAFVEPARDCTKLVGKLDPIVKMAFRNNPQKLAEWLVASHIERPPKPPKPQN